MPGTSLIDSYLVALSADLPEAIVDELADGLDETYRYHLGQGLDPDAAARAASCSLSRWSRSSACWPPPP